MKLENLKDLYIELLKDLYSAENQLVKALPKMAKQASLAELRKAFEEHLKQTKRQKDRLDKLFESLEVKSGRKKCKGMEGLIEEGSELLDAEGDDATIDAGLIAAAQRVEHYEIAGYGTARHFAEQLGEKRAAGLLSETLDEESAANQKLNDIAMENVNPVARERVGREG